MRDRVCQRGRQFGLVVCCSNQTRRNVHGPAGQSYGIDFVRFNDAGHNRYGCIAVYCEQLNNTVYIFQDFRLLERLDLLLETRPKLSPELELACLRYCDAALIDIPVPDILNVWVAFFDRAL